jgi:hypothetical protein
MKKKTKLWRDFAKAFVARNVTNLHYWVFFMPDGLLPESAPLNVFLAIQHYWRLCLTHAVEAEKASTDRKRSLSPFSCRVGAVYLFTVHRLPNS